MTEVFSQILNMTLTGSVVIMAVMLVRLCLKRLPKIYSYALWSVVLFRLLCPVSISSPVSLLELFRPQVQVAADVVSAVSYLPVPEGDLPAFEYVAAASDVQQLTVEAAAQKPAALQILSWIWIAGMLVMILYGFVQYLKLRRRLVGAIRYRGNIYLADHIDTAFVIGVLKPRIYLPVSVPSEERKYILAHEYHHIHRCDHVIKLLAYTGLCVHWFNPLAWLAFVLAGKDMEMSCDEAVIRKLGSGIRSEYSASLLRLAVHRRAVPGMPLAFGEGDTKGRIMNMAKWKKPKLWTSVLCVILCVAILAACGLNPTQEIESVKNETTETTEVTEVDSFQAFSDECINILITCLRNEAESVIPDATVLLSVHPDLHTVTVGSVLKDTYVSVPNYQGHVTGNHKFAVCYALGKNWGGIEGAEAMVNQCLYDNFGIVIDHNLELKGVEYEQLPDVLNELFDEKTVTLSQELQSVSDRLLAMIASSVNEINSAAAKTALADAKIQSCTIPAEGTYSGEERIIAGEKTYVLVMNQTDKPVSAIDGADIVTNTELIQYGALKMLLPDGYGSYEKDGEVVLTKDGIDVGGIKSYHPPYVPFECSIEYLRAMGLPEAQLSEEPIAYMIGNSIYGDLEAEFFHELAPETLNVQHYFFVDFDLVYDVYYDQNLLQDFQAEKILKTIERDGEQVLPPKPEEAESLELCRNALQSIQSGVYQISVNRINEGDYALNRASATVYTAAQDDWISITHVPDDDSYHGYMFVENAFYSNEGNGWAADGAVHWAPDPYPDQVYVPWIASFGWNREVVTYVDTIAQNGIKTVMLRVDEPFPGYDELTECYFVNVHFTEEGSFLDAEIFMDFVWENEISSFEITEALITLDEATVNEEIQKELKRATE